jgi:hypothetical protein
LINWKDACEGEVAMGVDWIPFRIEPGVSREEITRLATDEARRFRASRDWIDFDLHSLVDDSDLPPAPPPREDASIGPLGDLLLFKSTSHRVNVITGDDLFPLEWRLDAYRTILPWELPEQLERWRTYREEVARGKHRGYLLDLLNYVRRRALADFFREQLTGMIQLSAGSTSHWATQPALVVLREKLITCSPPVVPTPPAWSQRLEHEPNTDCLDRLLAEFARVKGFVQAWNDTVKRGNRKISFWPDDPALGLEAWVAEHLGIPWFGSFFAWVKPWVERGYGLYRDCE